MHRDAVAFVLIQAYAVLALAGCKEILGDVGDASCTECDAAVEGSLSNDGATIPVDAGPMDANEEAALKDVCADAALDGDSAAEVADGPDVATDTGPAQEAGCALGATRCDETGATVEECEADGGWQSRPCPAFCENGACQMPPSCGTGTEVLACGSNADESCCQSRTVPGGTFYRSYDGLTDNGTAYGMNYPATVSPFELDVFEVTVSRFRSFVAAYGNWDRPAPGSGGNPNDQSDMGWDATWTAKLPVTVTDLETELTCSFSSYVGTWTDTAASNELLPITCVDWYTAFAFCVWDGGRLPTEAEWNFAAAGGSEQRVYPWSSPPGNETIGSTDAVYGVAAPLPVGSTTAGVGKWGQFDLSGNAEEWVRDWFVDPYLAPPCVNCASLAPTAYTVLRGGNYIYDADEVSASLRDESDPSAVGITPFWGVRCARGAAVLAAVNDE
jgi:formylglycine-generating enzyme